MITCFDILIKSNGTQWYKFFSTKNCVLTSSAINNSMWKSAVRTEVTRVIVFVGQMPEGKCEGVRSHTANQCLGCWITVVVLDHCWWSSSALIVKCPKQKLHMLQTMRATSLYVHLLACITSLSIPTTVDSPESFRFNYPLSLLPAKVQWVSSRTFLPNCSI